MILILNLGLYIFFTLSLAFVIKKIFFDYYMKLEENSLLPILIVLPFSFYFSSILYFYNLILFENLKTSLIFLEFLLLISFIYIFLKIFKKKYKRKIKKQNNYPTNFLHFFFYSLFTLNIFIFFVKSIRSPHGEIDAIVSWNRAARFLFRDGGNYWLNNFKIEENFNSQYPLYIGSSVARNWLYLNFETTIFPIIFHLIHYFSVIFLLFYSLRIFLKQNSALISSIILSSSVLFLQISINQYADIAVSYFILFSFILLVCSQKNKKLELDLLFLVGLSIGITGWIKNEGLIYSISLISSIIFFQLLNKSFLNKKNYFLIIGFLIAIIPTFIKNIFYTFPNIFLSLNFKEKISFFLNFDRILSVFKSMFTLFFTGNNYIILFLLFLISLIGFKKRVNFEILKIFCLFFLFSTSFIFLVFLQMPYDSIEGIINAIYPRWQIQLLPTFLFCIFLVLNDKINDRKKRLYV